MIVYEGKLEECPRKFIESFAICRRFRELTGFQRGFFDFQDVLKEFAGGF